MQVRRLRRRAEKRHPLLGSRRRFTLAAAGVSAVALAVTGTGIGVAQTEWLGTDQVGQATDNGLVVSSDQTVKPYGDQMVINQGKIMSSTVSPDGTHLAASITDGGYAMSIVDLKSYKVQQLIGKNSAASVQISGNDVGQEGPTYSPDGKSLWLGVSDGYQVFSVNPDGSVAANPRFVSIPPVNGRHALVGQATFSPDASTVYSAVNGQNKVVAINAATGAVTQSWTVGTAPRDIALVGGKLYVSNEGGRPAQPGDTTMNSYGTQVPADPNTGAATTGTVSVIDTANPAAAPASIPVGLHPTAVYAKNGAVFVTDTDSNDVSVIDTSKNAVVQTIATQPWQDASVGYDPNAVTLTGDGHLLVTLGRANAVAVYRYTSPMTPAGYIGLLPTDYYPSEINAVGNQIVVSNTRGIDARRSTTDSHGTHDTTSSLTHFTLPSDDVIKGETGAVFSQNGWHGNSLAKADDRHPAAPVPVPVKLGDPSTIKHVFLIVKENRTYDQQFGDLPQGNGDPALTQYGENVTPNNHALASQFGLYDNAYDTATNSAEGHNWAMQADNPEYTESDAGQYTRSYDTEDDVLGHQRSGFIWTGAQAAGKTVKDYGEFQSFEQKPAGATWQNYYCDAKNMAATGEPSAYPIKTGSAIPSLNSVSVPGFPLFDLNVPDVYKAQVWKQDFEKNGPANLNMFWLSNDHTGGPNSAASGVADNDLALGQIVDTISHSKYWNDSAIFVMEDDSQAGADHVDGHRAPFQVISPYANHGVVDNHYYSQVTVDRTIEQILGIQPMNQMDTAATPMRQAFTQHPDFTPYNVVPNRTSLTNGLKTPPACGNDVPAVANPAAAPVPSATVPADKQQVAAQWDAWKSQQAFAAPNNAQPDSANPEQLNRYDWYDAHGWEVPYPGDNKVYAPSEVPGAVLPGSDGDG
ncbi:alkaline phosphatase family protein [Amycolatopsis sp.]|uniref:alkaline phosphatase family protein n=1 Tax=Amycolatopsis sp. TaxID=37632 RepID=UPI002CE58946|nr:alkaline phosphatase family protein [Amycolatopsis sp.]HVV12826.1 alkaline phosphatase family protein [Amycolatopsis sp.]